jgi:hypothetical protein
MDYRCQGIDQFANVRERVHLLLVISVIGEHFNVWGPVRAGARESTQPAQDGKEQFDRRFRRVFDGRFLQA